MLHTGMPIKGYIMSGCNYNISSMRNRLDYHILQHLYKYGVINIERQPYCLAFCATLVWTSSFELVSHSEFWISIVSSDKGFKSLFARVFK